MNSFGATLSPLDPRDYTLNATAITLPAEHYIPLPTVRHQGAVGSCVAHAAAEAGEVSERVLLSTDFIYGYRSMEPFGTGMSAREACETMLKKGNVALDVLPSNTENPECYHKVMARLDKLLPEAAKHKIKSYARIYTAQEAKQALFADMPILIVVPCYADFSASPGSYVLVNTPNSGGHAQGAYHAMLIVGYRGDYFRVLNSWGKNWGDCGFCWIHKNTLENPDTGVCEMWAIADEQQTEQTVRRTLKKGMRGDDVKEAQGLLKEHGFDAGTPDGIFGAKTYDATVRFQRTRKLATDGIIGKDTWAALDADPEIKPIDDKVALQQRLHEWGFGALVGEIDGIIGTKTKTAVKHFQAAMGLTADGIAGEKTWAALNGEIIVPRLTEKDLACQCNAYCDGYPQPCTTGVRILAERIWRELEKTYRGVELLVPNREHPAPDGAIAGGQRCVKWNRERGGAASSQHQYGTAVDLMARHPSYADSMMRQALEDTAMVINTKGGVGYGANYIVHIDIRGSKARWEY